MVVGYQIGKQDANSRAWLKVIRARDPQGNTVLVTNKAYEELATGLNYPDPARPGHWLPTKEEIDAYPGGAIAQFGNHKVIFANNLKTAGAIDLQMPDGQELKSEILGLSYYDTASGKSVLIAEVQSSQGRIVGSNQVVYPDGFKGIKANVVYKYTRVGLSQDVVLLEQPPSPESLGLLATSCVLQVLTEFTAAPTPVIHVAATPSSPTLGATASSSPMTDETLDFGPMRMIHGRAFLTGTNLPTVSVAKQWMTIQGLKVLVESVRLSAITNQLSKLPAFSKASLKPTGKSPLYAVSTSRLLPAPGTAKSDSGKMQLARENPVQKPSMVLDYYIVLNGDPNSYTFEGGQTYYISGPLYIGSCAEAEALDCSDEPNDPTVVATFEGGTVIKYAKNSGAAIAVNSVDFQTGPYRPAVFTASEDDSQGALIDGSTGDPSGYYADYALEIVQPNPVVKYARFCYANVAVRNLTALDASWNPETSDDVIRHSQFLHCNTGFLVDDGEGNYGNSIGGYLDAGNVLFSDVQYPFYGYNLSGQAAFLTVDTCNALITDGANQGGCFYIDDCLFANTTTRGSGITVYDQFWENDNVTDPGNTFQTVGGGHYYLVASSSFHGEGDAGEVMECYGTMYYEPTFYTELQQMTTYPPVVLPALMNITGDLTLSPEVPREPDTYWGNVDMGYHYPVLDYTVANINVAGGNVTVEPGTAIAVRNDYVPSQDAWTFVGFWLEQGSSFFSHGTPTKPITFTSTKMVQEEPETSFAQYQAANNMLFSAVTFVPDFEPNATGLPAPTLDFRFCNFSLPGLDYHIWSGISEDGSSIFTPDSAMYLSLRDCKLYGGGIDVGQPFNPNTFPNAPWTYPVDQVYGTGSISWVNNLFDRVNINLDPTYYELGQDDQGLNVDMQVQADNNLFRGGLWFHLEPVPASAGNWLFKDNLFDSADIVQDVDSSPSGSGAAQPLDYDYNAYWPLTPDQLANDYYYYPWNEQNTAELQPTDTSNDGFTDGTAGNHEVVLGSAPPYQTGPLGDYYLPDTTPLYETGSRTVGEAGFAQYTTRTDQTKMDKDVPVNIGLHYVATSSSTSAKPKDTDGDGIPDYVEDANGNGIVDWNPEVNANETDPTLAETDGTTPDAYNAAYDDIDISGNGLVGRIEKALGLNPLSPSNPLALNNISEDANTGIVACEVPVNYNTLTSIGNLELLVDGVAGEFQECDEAADGNCLLKWNSAFEPPGQYELAAEVILNGELKKGSTPDPTVLNGLGPIFPYNSDNVCQFDPAFSTFDQSGATLYATLPQPDATYTIELQDPNGNHIKWLAVNQTTTSGEINVPWNLTYDDDVTVYTGARVKAIVSVTLSDPSSGTLDYWLSRASTGPIGPTEYFTVAFAWNNASQASKGGSMWDAIMESVVNRLMEPCNVNWCYSDPYKSSFDAWDTYPYTYGNPGHLQSQSDVQNLLNSLKDGNTMNFYWDGHGSYITLSSCTSPNCPVVIYQAQVASALNNLGNVEGPLWHHLYRFVFLNACDTADDVTWASAFGIPRRLTTAELSAGQTPQAFLGWDGEPMGAQTSGDWDDLAQTYAVFWDAWMSEQYTLQQCIQLACDPSLSFPLNKKYDINSYPPFYHHAAGDFHLRIYGYAGIMRIGYSTDTGYDNSPYYR